MSDANTRLTAALEGRYAIEREIGEGGMAKVYLAKDLKHNRNVALKVLKPELAAVVGAERFLAEIETTANLQHPHILPLFDSGEADGFLFYVMPYIEGETLRDRIDREKQLPVDEALYIATSVANALQVAHEAGVIHRDIKPGNILLSSGEPLVSDFGIALAVGAAGGNRLTETGLSIGTPYYMSPEQATGDQAVGPASDIYAVACVLFEMLVGEPPYLGNTAQAVLGKIIQGVPVSATAARKAVPANVDSAIRKALEKLPADRFTQAGQFSKALSDHGFRWGEVAGSSSRSATRWRGVAVGGAVVAVLALVAAGVGWSRTGGPEPVFRQHIVPFTSGLPRPLAAFTALAPDGSSIVYAVEDADGSWQLHLKLPGAVEGTPLPGTLDAQNVTYSPDGQSIAFVSGNALRRRPVGDGSTIAVAEDLPRTASNSQVALAWLDDGTIVYELPGPVLMRIAASGGQADTVINLNAAGYSQLGYAGALPGSTGVLVTLCDEGNCPSSVIRFGVFDFEADSLRILIDDVVRGWYTPTGHLMYVRRDGAVFAAPFDINALETTGPGIPLFAGVAVSTTSPELVVAWDGTMLYSEGDALSESRALLWVDRRGVAEPVDPNIDPRISPRTVVLSPSGDRIAFTAEGGANSPASPQLWVKELPDGPTTRLTGDAGYTRRPAWTPDGQSIAYLTNETETVQARLIRADGSRDGAFDVLLERDVDIQEVLFTRDPFELVFREASASGGEAFLRWDMDAASEPVAIFASPFDEGAMALSPDARWLAYESDASGITEVFVRPFPVADTRVPVSTSGGESPIWAHNRPELFYVGEAWMWVATYSLEPTFQITARQRLFDLGGYYRESSGFRAFDVSMDDERLLMIGGVGSTDPSSDRVIHVQNYWTELRQRVGG